MTKYEIIKSDIIKKIKSGEYNENDILPSENELIELYKVSRTPVSKALSMLVAEGYIYRIQGKGSFVAPANDRISSALLRSPLNAHFGGSDNGPIKIAALLPGFDGYHGMKIASAIAEAASLPDYYLTITTTNDSFSEDYALKQCLSNNYDGIIIYPINSELYNETIMLMHLEKFPFVLIDRYFPGINTNYVTGNNAKGTQLLTEHLLSLGHENIAYCSEEDVSEQTTGIRFNTFCTTMKNKGIVLSELNNMTDDAFRDEKASLFETQVKNKTITAAVCNNSTTAESIYTICTGWGLSVPEDFSIVCFDNPSTIRSNANFYTYLDQQSDTMGRLAMDLLRRLIDNKHKKIEPQNIILEPSLYVNKSTAAPKK